MGIHIVHPFNYQYCFENLLEAKLLTGGVDRSLLPVQPVETLRHILGPQQVLVLEKARILLASDSRQEKDRASRALVLVRESQAVTLLFNSGMKVLYPSEYRVRADALVEARKLVGGVSIEKDYPLD